MAGIFKPTDISKYDVVIYSKWCVECIYSEFLLEINLWALHNDLDIKVVRTAYRPADHSEAMKYYAKRVNKPVPDCWDYPMLFIYGNKILFLEEFLEMIRSEKNKMIEGGEVKNDVQALPRAKRTRRKASVGVGTTKSEKKTKK